MVILEYLFPSHLQLRKENKKQLPCTWWQLPFSAFQSETSLQPAATYIRGLAVVVTEAFGGGTKRHICSTAHTREYCHEFTGIRNLISQRVRTPLEDPETNQFPQGLVTNEDA